jgi:hypothetical protein
MPAQRPTVRRASGERNQLEKPHRGRGRAGGDQVLDTSYRYLSEIMEKAPDETEWTLSKVNALEIGQQVG